MLKLLKSSTLQISKNLGIFGLVAGTRWRQQRLLILCYHGLSQKDEHKWRNLFIPPGFFRRRLEILARHRYRVLPLDDALRMLQEGNLPPKSVVITFDDGFHDFHQLGFPILHEFGFPSTVYQTTYYSNYLYPIFNLVLSYVFWRATARRIDVGAYKASGVFDLSKEQDRRRAVNALVDYARQHDYSIAQKNELAACIAGDLGVDYAEIMRLRMLHLMTPDQLREIAAGGVDVQLHTHRHRTPLDERSFTREIRENREWLAPITGTLPTHFCYPSGIYRPEFLPWLRAEHVVSAATCQCGLATRICEPLLLPRVLDSMHVTELDFESWLCGVSSLLPTPPEIRLAERA
jgi:hypothetical protein